MTRYFTASLICAIGALFAVEATAQQTFCADPGEFCGRTIAPECLSRVGAGSLAAGEAGAGCEEQMAAYRDCLTLVASQCQGGGFQGATAPATQPQAGGGADMMEVWAEIKDLRDPDVLEAFAASYPNGPLATLALKRAAALRAEAAKPEDAAQDAAQPEEKAEQPPRARLGVRVQGLTEASGPLVGLPDQKGALVVEVMPGSPAAKAGFEIADVVRSVDAAQVQSPNDLTKAMGEAKPGRVASVVVWRGGAAKTLVVELGEAWTVSRPAAPPSDEPKPAPGSEREVEALQATLATPDGWAKFSGGALATAVTEKGAAWEAGLDSGDLIVAVGARKVRNVDETAALIEAAEDGVLLLVVREGSSYYLPVPFAKK